MWLITNMGFFSVVEKPGDRGEGKLTVRGRARKDLEELSKRLPSSPAVTEGGGTDYPYRVRVDREELATAAAQLVREIGYANFKNEVHARQGAKRAKVYGTVWGDLLAVEKENTREPRRNHD